MNLKISQKTPSYPNFRGTKKPIGFMLRLAKALHLYGMTAYELEHTMKKIANSLKFDIQCLSQPTNIIMSFSYEKLEPITYVMRVEPGEVNLEKQLMVDDVVARCLQGSLNLESGGAELEQIIEQPSRFSSLLSLFAFALLSGAIARILGGHLFEIFMSLLIGGLTGALVLWVLTEGSAKLLFPTIASLLSALIAVVSSSLVDVSSPYIIMVSGIIVLVPGSIGFQSLSFLVEHDVVQGLDTAFKMGFVSIALVTGLLLASLLMPQNHFLK